jgi:hypothetical protein
MAKALSSNSSTAKNTKTNKQIYSFESFAKVVILKFGFLVCF